MFDFLPNNYNEINLLYVAISVFVFAILFEFWRRMQAVRKQRHSAPLSDRMEKAIHYFNENKKRTKITNDIYQELTGVSDATATRDLDKLEELGLVVQKGKTRGVYYLPTTKLKRHTKIHHKTKIKK